MTEKAQRTIYVKWVRSGIGFARWQKNAIRSLGLRRLHHVVERVDTPQIRGLVARIPRFVEVVTEPFKPAAWASVPEYTILPGEAQPAGVLKAVRAARSKRGRTAAAVSKEESAEVVAQQVAVPAKAKPSKAAKAAKATGTKEKKEKRAKAAKEPSKKKAKAAEKPAKAAKTSKKSASKS